MDGERFDALLRSAIGDASRRGLLRAGLGALAASTLGITSLNAVLDAEAGKRHRKKKKKKKPVQRCTGDRPVTCGPGCCSSLFPLCCPDVFLVDGVSCNAAGRSCCTIAQGGGSCPSARPKCCEPTPENQFGTCAVASDTCCPAGTADGRTGSCPSGQSCCPNALSNIDNEGCCSTVSSCCNVPGDCPAPFTGCANGCCVGP